MISEMRLLEMKISIDFEEEVIQQEFAYVEWPMTHQIQQDRFVQDNFISPSARSSRPIRSRM